jgi:hypothetical protein
MAVNLASKFEKKTSEALSVGRKTKLVTNQNWSWDGVNAINVYTLTDPTMGNYNVAAGSDRYGSPTEVDDTTQNFALTRDRSFSKVIDKLNKQDTMGVRRPAKYLAQTLKNVVIPEIDTYIIAAINTAGATANRDDIVADAASTAANAYTNFLAINADISNNEAPVSGRVALCTPEFVSFLKQSTLLASSDVSSKDKKSGVLMILDGVKVVEVPSTRMPASVDLIITHPDVCVAPEKLVDYTLHNNPPGISGDRLDYRHRYDAFVDTNKVNCVGIHRTAA